MEARITIPVFPLSTHLYTLISLMKKARDKCKEKLVPSRGRKRIPYSQQKPASQPASQPPVIPGIPPAFRRDWEYPEGI